VPDSDGSLPVVAARGRFMMRIGGWMTLITAKMMNSCDYC